MEFQEASSQFCVSMLDENELTWMDRIYRISCVYWIGAAAIDKIKIISNWNIASAAAKAMADKTLYVLRLC